MKRIALAFLLLLLVAAGLGATGWPQRKLVEFAAGRALGVDVEVIGLTTVGAVRIDELRIFTSSGEEPVFEAKGIVVDYTLFPKSVSHIRSITIDEITARLDASDPENTNFDFLLQPSGRDPAPFIPERVRIESLALSLTMATAGIALSGVGISATAQDGNYALTVTSNAIDCSLWNGSPENLTTLSEGYFQLQAATGPEGLQASLVTDIPGLIEADCTLSAPGIDPLDAIQADLKTLKLYGADLPDILNAFIPLPVRFDVMDCSGTSFRIALEEGRPALPRGRIQASVSNLVLGEAQHSLFTGDLSVEGDLEGDETLEGTINLTINRGQDLQITLSGGPERGQVRASFEAWPREAVTGIVPTDFRSYFETLEYELLGGLIEVDWAAPEFKIHGEIQSQGTSGGAEEAIRLAINAHGGKEDEALLDGDFDFSLGEGSIRGTAQAESAEQYTALLVLEEIDPRPWAQFLGQASLPEAFEANLRGTVSIDNSSDPDFVLIAPQVSLTPFAYKGFRFEQVEITGVLQLKNTFDGLRSDQIQVKVDEYTYLQFNDLVAETDPLTAQGTLEGNADLAAFASGFGLDDLWGEIACQGSLRLDGDRMNASISARTDLLGYGDLTTPYGTPLEVAATLSYDAASARGAVNDFEARLGEGTLLTMEQADFGLSPLNAQGQLAFRSDLAPVVDMGLLGPTDGAALAKAQFVYSDDKGLQVQWQVSLETQALSLPDDVASIKGLSIKGEGDYGDRLNGSGIVAAELISAAGAQISSLSGTFEFQGEDLVIPEAKASLFGGELTAEVRARLFEEGAPISLSATVDRIDLDQFTKEVQPPTVVLTGLAKGAASLEYALDGLRGFRVDLHSDEGFTLNRDAVEQVLRSEQFQSLFGSKKMEKAMGKFLGAAPQRPFDSADLQLRLEGERITGNAVLKSEKTRDYNGLNLTIDIATDLSALAETLKLLEQSAVENVDF